MKVRLITFSILTLIICSNIAYSMTDEEFRQKLQEIHDELEHLGSVQAQTKLDIAERIKQTEVTTLSEVQNMFITYDEKMDARTDPFAYAMPVISFILVLVCFYLAMLGVWWGKYHFFSQREEYIKELNRKKEPIDDSDLEELEERPKRTTKSEVTPLDLIKKERIYQDMLDKHKKRKTKGMLIFGLVFSVFIIVLILFILPKVGLI